MPFLGSLDPRPLAMDLPPGFRGEALFLGSGGQALEVAVVDASRKPTAAELRQIHKHRVGGRATPVVVVILHSAGKAAIAGPVGDELEVELERPRAQVESICLAALQAPDRHAAIRFLNTALGQLAAPIPGLRNAGLFALHELEAGVPHRTEWGAACGRSKGLLTLRGRQLVEQLGFTIQPLPGPESILVANGRDLAVALFLDRADQIEPPSPLFNGISPVSAALARADQKNLDYVVIAAGSTLRLYPVKLGVGTGRRGRTETYVEMNLDLLSPDQAGYLWLLYSADALTSGGSFDAILAASSDYAANLGDRLRERVYNDVVPRLAAALVRARRLRAPSPEKLRETYQMTLLVLFRLLFTAYAEDKELLPLHQNPAYRKHCLKEIAKQLAIDLSKATQPSHEDFYWSEVTQLWKAVDKGNKGWGVPPYNGGLFSAESGPGKALSEVALRDADFVPALAALLVDDTGEGTRGPIDFRSLGVREFGTIYEGLLESELSVAEQDLAVDPKTRAYVPVKGRATVQVPEGEVYLHNASGARKSSGAYYTKHFAVEHLLDHALEPALKDHLARLDDLDPRTAASRLFEFRVADIAMGSGHFLVAAIDRIERQFSNYLARRPLPGVTDELERLRSSALEALGPEWVGDSIEDTLLLRRQIARRCICGVDLNPLAVELARLSIWIHTFVPGLPLSFLDANLVQGNALVGVATLDEARDLLAGEGDLFTVTAEQLLAGASKPLDRLARLSEATAAEVREARQLFSDARTAIQSAQDLLTVLAASRTDDDVRKAVEQGQVAAGVLGGQGDAFIAALVRRAERALKGLAPLHFPVAFPQVFLGERGGFDVILGNPPWEKVKLEEHEFWARHYPGFRGLTQTERQQRLPGLKRARPDLVAAYEEELSATDALRHILLQGPFPGIGTGDPDLYKAFCWRFWQLIAHDGGRIGVVLPRAVFAAKGSEEFRKALFEDLGATDLTTLVNSRGWVFEEVHPQFSIGLVAISRGMARPSQQLTLRGPYASRISYDKGKVSEPARFPYNVVKTWTASQALPLLPADKSGDVFAALRRSPRFDGAGNGRWRARAFTELHTTRDKALYSFADEPKKGQWPVYTGESFDLWTPDTGEYYAFGTPQRVIEKLQETRVRAQGLARSAYSEFSREFTADPRTLACHKARIAFRNVSRATDSRTVRVSLVPPRVFLVENAPFLLWPAGDARDEAFLLGVMSSLNFDWYARRFVETHLTFDILNALPVPDVGQDKPLHRRVVDTAGRLACSDKRLEQWAEAIGLKPKRMPTDEEADLVHELDATVAHLYGLSEAQLVHIFETFHEGWDFQDRLDATLKHFHNLKSLA